MADAIPLCFLKTKELFLFGPARKWGKVNGVAYVYITVVVLFRSIVLWAGASFVGSLVVFGYIIAGITCAARLVTCIRASG